MELSIKTTAFFLSALVFFFVSCKKEEIKKEETISVRIPPINRPPVAKAGADATIILPVNTTLLFGDESYDPDNGDKIVSYKWTKISGPNFFILQNESEPVCIAKNLIKGTYLFELSVSDSEGLTSKDTVLVRVDLVTESTLIFENLTWRLDTSQKFVYMLSPTIQGGYSVDSVLSVYISIFDFDYARFVWRRIGKGGYDVGRYYYKIAGNKIMVYKYYEGSYQYINFYVENKIKVEFKI